MDDALASQSPYQSPPIAPDTGATVEDGAVSEPASHEFKVTIALPCDDAFLIRALMQGIARTIADEHRDVLVPNTLTVHSEGEGGLRWTWQTESPTRRFPGPVRRRRTG